MKLYCYRDPIGNFGDDLNLWLWPKLVPGILDDDDGRLFIGIGTLLNHRVPALPEKVVLGSGVGYGRRPVVDDRWTIYGVRGPLSARMMELGPELALTDPAMLVGQVETFKGEKCYGISLMPHHRSAGRVDWKRYCGLAGVHYLDPCGSVLDVLKGIKRSHIVVTEAMHGAIVADALRVPWIPLRLYEHVLPFKWEDWCASMDVPYEPVTLPLLMNLRHDLRARWHRKIKSLSFVLSLKRLVQRVPPVLSTDAAFDRAVSRLQEAVVRLEGDYLAG
jgi:succinoglycan biosynthesis protein ExoV